MESGWAGLGWVGHVDGGFSVWITGAVKGRPGHI